MNLSKKLLYIFVFCIFILLILNINVFASVSGEFNNSNTSGYNLEHAKTILDNNTSQAFVIYYGLDGEIYLRFGKGDCTVGINGDYVNRQYFNFINNTNANGTFMHGFYVYKFNKNTNEFEYESESSTYTTTKFLNSYDDILFSSVDIMQPDSPNIIYYHADDLDYFFQLPVTEVVIPTLETAEQIPEAITTTLKIMIPVGLIVLSVGLVIYLIKRVISLTC